MNDLTLWKQIAPRLRGGEIFFFDGAPGFLDDAIQFVTHSKLTHAAMVLDPKLPIQGKSQARVNLIESTILTDAAGQQVDGPQINDAEWRITTYDKGGRIWVCLLDDRVRALLDFAKMWALAFGKIGKDRYNKIELLEYVVRDIPLVNDLPVLYDADSHREVCSEFCCDVLQAGGLPGLLPFQMPPQKLAELKIYSECVQIVGRELTISGFNTV
ncbi:MAG: hypothetical protein JO336_12175 [Acidobacteriia bacterium]|nr:hypothetical protein [Terriglobia bacterium]